MKVPPAGCQNLNREIERSRPPFTSRGGWRAFGVNHQAARIHLRPSRMSGIAKKAHPPLLVDCIAESSLARDSSGTALNAGNSEMQPAALVEDFDRAFI